jgi:DNA-binding beta-propeller fold protein YncE
VTGIRRVPLTVLVVLGVLVGMLALSGAPALAVLAYGPITGHIGNPGVAGSGSGEFSAPDGVAVDQGTHDVYVVDRDNNRVEKFNSSGGYLSQLTEVPASSGASVTGPFENPTAVAVDPLTEDVYVADSGHNVVDRFSASGEYLSQLTGQPPTAPESKAFSDPDGLAVDPTSGDLYVSDREDKLVDIFMPSGEWTGQFPTEGRPWSLAINSSNAIYVAMAGAEKVTEYTEFGDSVVRLFESEGGFGHVRTVGIDLETNNALLGAEVEGVYQLEEVNSSGEHTAQRNFGGEEEMSPPGSTSPGIAVDPASGTVYAVDTGKDVVDIFALVRLANPETGNPSEVKGTTAKVSGLVNPEGIEAHYFFEYGPCAGNSLDGCAGSPYPEKTPEMALAEPAGSTPEPASAFLSGLSPETIYHYQLVGVNANGEKQGKEVLVTTGPAIAGVSTGVATNVQTTSVTLNGLLDPEGTLTHYFFEYVSEEEYDPAASNPYGNGTSTENESGEREGAEQEAASMPIAGLDVGTSYHYRIVTSNEHGVTYGGDQTLTTLPALPVVDAHQASFTTGVAPHEATFHGTVNPGRGVTSYHFVYGETAAYGSSTPEAYTQLNYEDDPVEQLVTRLSSGVTLHYALIATNASGTTIGPDEEFRTLEGTQPPPEAGGPSGPSLEVTSIPGIIQPLTPALLPTPVFPAIKRIRTQPSPSCRRGFVKEHGKCVRSKPARAKKHRK